MAAVADAVPTAHASAFSNGTDQVLSNTAILNAGGNIIYFEWNPQSSYRPSISSHEPHTNFDTGVDVESLSNPINPFTTISELLSSGPSRIIPRELYESHVQPNLQPNAEGPIPPTSLTPLASSQLNVTSGIQETVDEFDESHSATRSRIITKECSEVDEMNVVMIPNHKPEFCPTEVLIKSPSSYEVYVETMFPLKHGYPLWLPQPDRNLPIEYRRKGLSVGDVGFITYDGSFDFLFNIWTTTGSPINLDDLSNGFESSASLPELQTSLKTSFPPRSMISNIAGIEVVVKANREISYSFAAKGPGAILSMPHGAVQEDYKNERILKEYIGRNAESWYRYALKCGRDIDRHSLYLVTGSLKSRAWGIATYDTTVPNQGHSTLILSKSTDPEGPAYEWKKSGKATTFRTGPVPDATTDTQSRIPNDENQCLFLRGFKISLSEEVWRQIDVQDANLNKNGKRRADSPDSYDSRKRKNPRINEDGATTGNGSSSNRNEGNTVGITNFPIKQKRFHPLNVINDMLFSQALGARVAITHDNQWSEVGFSNLKKDQDFRAAEGVQERIQSHFVVGYDKGIKTCTLERRAGVETSDTLQVNNGIKDMEMEIYDGAKEPSYSTAFESEGPATPVISDLVLGVLSLETMSTHVSVDSGGEATDLPIQTTPIPLRKRRSHHGSQDELDM
ncbi:hypothetical protein BDQ17DRAFT_1365950 [Cyathus striatus]|nr:hypothetical protein BDQ17DRAFT_1365950 [Cyathus striatus]